ncbi:hypothetical protein WME73_20690 [Sorangium sp. So ce302]|uniref:hypothetical protein n=1 Tax=unclassified Sorangium TaxID=2621164 RepID=UPI003F601794
MTSDEHKPHLDDLTIERCAALTARIAQSKADKARILEEQALSPERWAAIERRWADAIRSETKKGGKSLLDRFDAAYVEQIEKDRGTIAVGDYARLIVAAERGTTDNVLKELRLPHGAAMRIERVWNQRFVKNHDLEEQVGEALDAARR